MNDLYTEAADFERIAETLERIVDEAVKHKEALMEHAPGPDKKVKDKEGFIKKCEEFNNWAIDRLVELNALKFEVVPQFRKDVDQIITAHKNAHEKMASVISKMQALLLIEQLTPSTLDE